MTELDVLLRIPWARIPYGGQLVEECLPGEITVADPAVPAESGAKESNKRVRRGGCKHRKAE